VTFGYASDALGRKRTYILYLLTASVAVLAYVATKNAYALLVLGPFVAFFASGHFSGFGVVTAEIYPTNIRATAQWFTYNLGLMFSAIAPYVVGSLAEIYGFRSAMSICAVAYLLAAAFWIFIPETKGRSLA
jgi:MFS family permease